MRERTDHHNHAGEPSVHWYSQGCGHVDCRAAHTEYRREWRRAQRDARQAAGKTATTRRIAAGSPAAVYYAQARALHQALTNLTHEWTHRTGTPARSSACALCDKPRLHAVHFTPAQVLRREGLPELVIRRVRAS